MFAASTMQSMVMTSSAITPIPINEVATPTSEATRYQIPFCVLFRMCCFTIFSRKPGAMTQSSNGRVMTFRAEAIFLEGDWLL